MSNRFLLQLLPLRNSNPVRWFTSTSLWHSEKKPDSLQRSDKKQSSIIEIVDDQRPIVKDYFQERKKEKTKDTFIEIIDVYKAKMKKTGHVEFVYGALKKMQEYGVHEDLEIYKRIIDVMPKGPYVPTSMLQSEYFYYPRHQECIIDLLQQMEENGVMPDWDMQEQLLSIFGKRSYPIRRYWRMMYWMPKFKNINPWPLPRPVPRNPLELAKLGISRVCSVDLETKIQVWKTEDLEDAIDKTWIVNGQSRLQRELLERHPENTPIFIEGAFRLYLRKSCIMYFILRADPPKNRKQPPPRDPDDIKNLKIPFFEKPTAEDSIPRRTIHEQNDGTIFAVAATGHSSKESLLSWIRLLEKNGNPKLARIPIVFKMKSPIGDVEPAEGVDESEPIAKRIK